MPVVPYTRAQVAEGKRVASDLATGRWHLGDLARDIAPGFLPQFAAEIGVDVGELREYQRIAEAVVTNRTMAPWSGYVEVVRSGVEDPVAFLKGVAQGRHRVTIDEIRRALGKKGTNYPKPAGTVREKAAAVRDFMSDPEVRAELISSEEGQTVVQRAAAEHSRQRAVEHSRTRDAVGPTGIGQVREQLSPLVRSYGQLVREHEELIEEEVALDAEDLALIRAHHTRLGELISESAMRSSWASTVRSATEKERDGSR
jgi:hypothetical protein